MASFGAENVQTDLRVARLLQLAPAGLAARARASGVRDNLSRFMGTHLSRRSNIPARGIPPRLCHKLANILAGGR